MLLRQLFDNETFTYTYLIGDESSREALLIDPVIEQTDSYIQLVEQLGLRLIYAADTHVHADHITALGTLREKTGCQTLISEHSSVECASIKLADKQTFNIGSLTLSALYTPGHTSDSVSYHLLHNNQHYLFTGDTLLIRGTGRTDFQNGSAKQLYSSLQRLMGYPSTTLVYPGHDYKGWTLSTLGEEQAHNPRLQTSSQAAFVELMNNLKLPNPKYMDVAVPANLQCGQKQNAMVNPNE